MGLGLSNMNVLRTTNIFPIGVVLTVLGIFIFGIAYSSYQSSNANYQTCLRDFSPAYCNVNVPLIPWGVPLQIMGGILTALGLGFALSFFLGKLESKKPSIS